MVKKKDKKVGKKVSKLTEDERDELKQEGELPKKSTREVENKQLIGFFVVVVLVFAMFLVPYFYIQSQKTFDHLGLVWSVEDYDELTIYHTVHPIIASDGSISNHNTYLRNDPRENDIGYNAGEIQFRDHVILLHTPETITCRNQILVTSLLGQTFGAFSFVNEVAAAVDNKKYSEDFNLPYASRANSTQSTIFYIKNSEQTEIVKDGKNYIINLESCEDNLLAAERLVIELIDQLDYKPL